MTKERLAGLIGAASKVDRMAGYQPCFHLRRDGSFCGLNKDEEHAEHLHVSFADLLREVSGPVEYAEVEYPSLRPAILPPQFAKPVTPDPDLARLTTEASRDMKKKCPGDPFIQACDRRDERRKEGK